MTLLFCNVGWMEHYQGLQNSDRIVGGGSYVQEKGMGHEVCNFYAHNGVLYGYVQPRGRQIDIGRLGAERNDDFITDVTVVWTAARPTGGTVVIGWYRNATVFRDWQNFRIPPRVHRRNGLYGYWIKAPANLAKLLTVDERTCEIPRQVKGSMGQAHLWYADSPESEPVVRRVRSVLDGDMPKPKAAVGRSRQQDQETKARVEDIAIRMCSSHFEGLGYSVKSVEKDNVGWDLEAQSGRTTLRIEVKGLSGGAFSIELTPNEYRAFAAQSADYRLAVVTRALSEPELSICRYSQEQRKWLVEGKHGKTLKIQTWEGASIRAT